MIKIKEILFSLFLCILTVNSIQADTLFVNTGHIKSIKEAISRAKSYDVILVSKGIYKENNIVINKPIKLIGQDLPILDGEKKYEIITITSDSVEVNGFQIQHVGKSYTMDWAGIKVDEKDHVVISNNKLYDTFFGIYLKKTKHCKVWNNSLETTSVDEVNSGNGIHLWDCENISIVGNHIVGHRDGIYFEFVEESEVRDNISENNLRYGLHFMFSNNDIYDGNIFKNNGTGVAVMFSKNIIMTNNIFLENWGSASFGLLFKEIYDGILYRNVFQENTVGLYADGANRIEVKENEFIKNGWAINILGNSQDNTISRNNFLSNTFDVATNTKTNPNLFEGNYWDQYTGYDLDKNGIGDVPFRPIKVFSYVIGKIPESIILLRSLFIEMLNFAEKVAPVLTPETLFDESPNMTRIEYD